MKQLTTNTGNILSQPNVLNVVKHELFATVNSSIAKCYTDLNLKVPDLVSIDYLVNEVTDSIMERFPSLRLAEIPIAFSNGIRNQYGEYFGLSVISFEQFIKGYLESESRIKLIEDRNKTVFESEKPEPTDEQKATLMWNNLIDSWKHFKEHGYFNDIGNAVFNTLKLNGKIAFTQEQRDEFKATALANLNKQYNPLNYMGNTFKMNECRAIIEEINNREPSTRVIIEAKKIALNYYFNDLLKMDMEIQDLF